MRVLVTGGAGFIGSHVAEAYLAAGHEVAVLDDLSTGNRENVQPGVRFYPVDVRSAELPVVLAEFRPDVINHHAAQLSVSVSTKDPQRDADINILGTLNLLEAAVRHKVGRVIFASTGGAVYGDKVSVPTSEAAVPQPVCPYGVAKLAVEKYLAAYQVMHGLRAVALRYSNVYGPRQSSLGEAGVVAIFCRAILEERELIVNGDGEQTRDYVYVGDVVHANMLAMEMPLGEDVPIFNIGTGQETSVKDLVLFLRAVAGKDVRWRHGSPRPGEQRRSVLECSRVKQAVGWEASTNLETGLAWTLRWFADKRTPAER